MSSNDTDLESLPGVGSATAESLRDAGYTTILDVATATPSKLSQETNLGDSKAEDVTVAAQKKADIGSFESGQDIMERRNEIGKLSLLVDEVDDLMGGGIETQSITEVFGEFGSGKSQITHQLAVNVQLQKQFGGLHGSAMFVDTEDTFRPERIQDMVLGLPEEVKKSEFEHRGLDDDYDYDTEEGKKALVEHFLEYIDVSNAYNASHQTLLVKKQAKEQAEKRRGSDYPVRLLAVDSIIAHFRAEYVGRGELANRQQKLNKHMHDILRFARTLNAAAIITNQVQSDPDSYFGDPTKSTGGNIMGHTSNFRVYLRKSKDNKRVFKLINSPNLEDGEAVLRITNDGVVGENDRY